MKESERQNLLFRTRNPDNLEGSQEVFDASHTAVEAFFVRNHFDVPAIDVGAWTLGVEGSVDRPQVFRFDDLQHYEQREVVATMECAGNGRARLGERAKGVPWRGNAIGTARWSGVALQAVLNDVGIRGDVEEVVFVGADSGVVETYDGAELSMPYARGLPREKALLDEVLIATHMNGKPLTPAHGYPARLIVPGWYGMASVKWLVRIIALDHRFDGYFQTEDYAVWEQVRGLAERRSLGPMAIKSHIGYPLDGQHFQEGEDVTIRGFAWGGEGKIEAVEVSFDEGMTFHAATLSDSQHPYAWRAWSYDWTVPDTAGEVTMYSRARTDRGESQPRDHDWTRGAYAVNAMLPVTVFVGS